MEKNPLEKIKYYDLCFKILGVSLLVLFVVYFIDGYSSSVTETISIISAIIMTVCMVIINWGMLYHQVRSGSYEWLFPTILLFFIGAAPIVLMLFYWVKMRKEFKKGNGIYS